jgi:hypothetical protein
MTITLSPLTRLALNNLGRFKNECPQSQYEAIVKVIEGYDNNQQHKEKLKVIAEMTLTEFTTALINFKN